MPNFDGGHYFLTVLFPVRTDIVERDGVLTSPIHLLREALSLLPKAQQSPVTAAAGRNSPFARNLRTHFARLFVIDDVIYEGRERIDPLKVAIAGAPGLHECDQLSCPYLAFVVEFDAQSGRESELRGYLAELWDSMGAELTPILACCQGGDDIADAASFEAYIVRCQVETTMPFNDYSIAEPGMKSGSNRWIKWIAAAVVAPLVAGLFLGLADLIDWVSPWEKISSWPLLLPILLFAAVVGVIYVPLIRRFHAASDDIGIVLSIFGVAVALLGLWVNFRWWWLIVILGCLIISIFLALAYLYVLKKSKNPFATAPNSDLNSVLKALYIQQKFVSFVIDMQGAKPPKLHKNFAEFIAKHKPSSNDGPTQAAGTVRS